MTNKIGLRKIDFYNRFQIKDFSNYIATEWCADDWRMTEVVDYTSCHEGKFPKSSKDGHWNMFENYRDMFNDEGINYFIIPAKYNNSSKISRKYGMTFSTSDFRALYLLLCAHLSPCSFIIFKPSTTVLFNFQCLSVSTVVINIASPNNCPLSLNVISSTLPAFS